MYNLTMKAYSTFVSFRKVAGVSGFVCLCSGLAYKWL